MAKKRAKPIPESDVPRIYRVIEAGRDPIAGRLKMDLSLYAGLRACEIARLSVDAFLDANGEVGENLVIFGNVGKMGSERCIPIHPVLRQSMEAFLETYPDIDYVAVGRRKRQQSAHAVTVWFYDIYRRAGLKGCSSHSGRRTFITKLAQRVGFYNGSLRDVQDMAGHARLDTTQAYIEPSQNRAKLIASLGSELDGPSGQKRLHRRRRPPHDSHDIMRGL